MWNPAISSSHLSLSFCKALVGIPLLFCITITAFFFSPSIFLLWASSSFPVAFDSPVQHTPCSLWEKRKSWHLKLFFHSNWTLNLFAWRLVEASSFPLRASQLNCWFSVLTRRGRKKEAEVRKGAAKKVKDINLVPYYPSIVYQLKFQRRLNEGRRVWREEEKDSDERLHGNESLVVFCCFRNIVFACRLERLKTEACAPNVSMKHVFSFFTNESNGEERVMKSLWKRVKNWGTPCDSLLYIFTFTLFSPQSTPCVSKDRLIVWCYMLMPVWCLPPKTIRDPHLSWSFRQAIAIEMNHFFWWSDCNSKTYAYRT